MKLHDYVKMPLWSILSALLILFSTTASAQNIKMMFWYPGEAGTTEEAQTPLDAMFEYLNKEIAPDKISGKYFNSVEAGKKYLSNEKPDLAIVSFAASVINAKELSGATQYLKTLPLPSGNSTENYVVMGKGTVPAKWDVELYSKQPLTPEFAAQFVLNDPAAKPKITTIASLITTLKEIDSGTKNGGIILQPMEHFTVKNISQPWAKNLSVWKTSSPVSSAPFLSLKPNLPEKLKAAFLKMSSTEDGREILETLRLKGFSN